MLKNNIVKEARSLYHKFFGPKPKQSGGTIFEVLNQNLATFSNFSGNLYDEATVRSCIHAIAANCAKLKPRHLLLKSAAKGDLGRVLSLRPNIYMNSYDFIYKLVTQYYCTNNAFVYIHYDNSYNIEGFYPINYSNLRLLDVQGEMFVEFSFMGGKKVILPYSDLIHIRRHFNENDIFGSAQAGATFSMLNVLHSIDQGIINTIRLSAGLRGLIKFGSVVDPNRQKEIKKEFVESYANINNADGFAALDASAEFIPLTVSPQTADDKQMSIARDNLYRYFNISENIVRSNYTEIEYNAFYSSVVEPIAIQLSLEFTYKVFTEKALDVGNEIVFSAERMTFASNATKASIISQLAPLGILSINEGREIFELPKLTDEFADRHIISLNYVDATKANKYQNVEGSDDNNADGKQEKINPDD